MVSISNTVGKEAFNERNDVLTVQRLLNANIISLVPAEPTPETGFIAPQTIFLIDLFQRRRLNMVLPTSIVAPDSATLKALVRGWNSPGLDVFAEMQTLENAATEDGYDVTRRVTAFRKIYYDSARPQKKYAGAAIGGGAWNILIPAAAGTALPPSWQKLNSIVQRVRRNQVVTIGGKRVDIGHLFAGLDARNHPTQIKLVIGTIRMRSNHEAATFIGDLGSVVVEYLKGSKESFSDKASKRRPELERYYDGSKGQISTEDMNGNADSYALEIKQGETVCQALNRYYTTRHAARYEIFARKLGIGSGDIKKKLQEEVFNSALAYAAATGHRTDVTAILADPGPKIIGTSLWEGYWNVSGFVVDIFLERIKQAG